MRGRGVSGLFARALLAAAGMLVAALPVSAQNACVAPGAWTVPGRGGAAAGEVLSRAAAESVVLLGEAHENADHHRWQLQTVAALSAMRPKVALGFEAFPRRVQPVLDRWIAGELSERDFLESVEWRRVWGYDAALYLPLFHFARLNRIPMIALNVEESFVRAVSTRGLEAVPAEKREGVTRAAPASEAYLERLFRIYAEHPEKGRSPARSDAEFHRFVDAQLVWDRAMAQAIAERLARDPGVLVLAIMGSGHVAHGHGVAHQLRDMGIGRIATLLPWDTTEDCRTLVAGLASAVFGLPAARPGPPKQLLGIMVETAPNGVRVSVVHPGSVAETTGLRVGDVLIEAAGVSVKAAGEVRAIVESVAPGTWLPLKVLREGKPHDLVARFSKPAK